MAKRTLYFDLLTIVSCFAVVCLHCNALVHSFEPTPSWDAALVVEVVAYFAVPVFFMLTGANNMRYREKYGTGEFLKRRLKKLVIPFVIWSLLIYLLQHVVVAQPIDATIGGFLTSFMAGTIEPIYWFFFAIISLTLAMPVLSLLADHRKALWYLVGVSFALMSVAPLLFKAVDLPWNSSLNLPVAGGYVMYAVLGYLVATGDVPKKYRIAVYVAAVACLVFRYAFTYVGSYELGATDRTLFTYTAFTAVLPALAVFLLFKQHDWSSPFFSKHARAITAISGCSFGIYLIHKIILDYLIVGYLDIGYDRILLRIVCPFVLYLGTLGIVYLIKKIPVIRGIVP
ncbi:acyltransferase [Raoultibacter phocaeensis]|uniref:acyltransferase n=1 Tax=Raoultibacter phocaeensis TaxID=2479841 RepID=UPI0015D6511E|nr:acyltransferase [Raoultibacter phocaeensis]